MTLRLELGDCVPHDFRREAVLGFPPDERGEFLPAQVDRVRLEEVCCLQFDRVPTSVGRSAGN